VLLKRYAQQKLLGWQEKEMDQLLEQSRKRQHFESTEKTCNMTVLSVVPQLTSQICQNLDSDSITLLLRNKAPNKVQLWEQLKVVGFSRIISLIYSDVLLVILLRTQVHMLGAYLYLSNKNPDDSALELNPEVQSRFLSASSHFLSTGIERLCQFVERVVSLQVSGLSLKSQVTLSDLERILHDSRIAVENELSLQPATYLAEILFPQSDPATPANELLMLNETRGVLESREVRDLVSNCANVGVSCVLDKLAEVMISLAGESDQEFVHPNRAKVYVAKLIPELNNFIHGDEWLQQLLKMDNLCTFGANVYESFSG